MQSKLQLPKDTTVPNHIAIIPDGNRRWARARGLYTLEGHKAGFDASVKVCRAAREWGVHTITLWGFSTENWDRTKEEINYLMKLYSKSIDDFLDEDLFFIYSSINNPITLFMIGAWDKERVLDAILILPLLRYIIILCYVNLESKKVVLSISILL